MASAPPIGRSRTLSGGGGFRPSPFEFITLLVTLAVSTFAGFQAYERLTAEESAPAASTFAPTIRTTMTSSVSATGTVQSSQQVSLTFDVGQGGGKIQEFFVRLGDRVVAGQPLAKLDDTDLRQSLRSAESGLASAEARLNAAISPSQADIASAQQSVSSAQSSVINAQKNYDDLRAGPKQADILTAQQSHQQSQASVLTAQTNLTRGQAQVQTDQNAVNQAQIELGTAQSTLSSAVNSANILRSNLLSAIADCGSTTFVAAPPVTGSATAQTMSPLPFGFRCNDTTVGAGTPTPSTTPKLTELNSRISAFNSGIGSYNTAVTGVQTRQNALTSANTTLTNSRNALPGLQTAIQTAQTGEQAARQKYQDTIAGPKQSEIDASQASLDAAKASLASSEARFNQLLNPKPDVVLPLRASVDAAAAQVETARKLLNAATITAPFDGQISQLNGDVGTQVASNTVVFILLNPSLIRIDANVDQAFVSDLRANQTANVTFDALAGRAYQASVTAIGLTPTVQQGVVSYVVTLGIDTSRLPQGTPIPAPGMTAQISVTTNRVENALAVPARAVRRIGRNQTVTVKTAGGGQEQKTVTTGVTSGTLIQITNGLQDGDEVLINTPPAATGARPGGASGPQIFGPP